MENLRRRHISTPIHLELLKIFYLKLNELNKARRKNNQLKEQLQHAQECIYNYDNEEFSYQKENLEEAIEREENIALLLKEEKGNCERLKEGNKQLKQEMLKLKREMISQRCKDDIFPLKVELEEAKRKEEVLQDLIQ